MSKLPSTSSRTLLKCSWGFVANLIYSPCTIRAHTSAFKKLLRLFSVLDGVAKLEELIKEKFLSLENCLLISSVEVFLLVLLDGPLCLLLFLFIVEVVLRPLLCFVAGNLKSGLHLFGALQRQYHHIHSFGALFVVAVLLLRVHLLGATALQRTRVQVLR